MRNRLIAPALTCALLIQLMFPVGTSGQSQGQRKRATPVSPYAITGLDTDIVRLPRNYRGVDPEALYKQLEKRSKESNKGEFETTVAFNARRQREQAEKVVGPLGLGDLIPIVAESNGGLEGVEANYDADAEELMVYFESKAPKIGVGVDLNRRAARLRFDLHPTTTYVGMNAYGAKAVIEKKVAYIYSLLFENISAFSGSPVDRYSDSGGGILSRLKLPPTSAREAKEKLRVLFLVRLSLPLIEKGYMSKKPTISEPTEYFVVYHHLVANVEQIWLYNFDTGEVYKKIRPLN